MVMLSDTRTPTFPKAKVTRAGVSLALLSGMEDLTGVWCLVDPESTLIEAAQDSSSSWCCASDFKAVHCIPLAGLLTQSIFYIPLQTGKTEASER